MGSWYVVFVYCLFWMWELIISCLYLYNKNVGGADRSWHVFWFWWTRVCRYAWYTIRFEDDLSPGIFVVYLNYLNQIFDIIYLSDVNQTKKGNPSWRDAQGWNHSASTLYCVTFTRILCYSCFFNGFFCFFCFFLSCGKEWLLRIYDSVTSVGIEELKIFLKRCTTP